MTRFRRRLKLEASVLALFKTSGLALIQTNKTDAILNASLLR